MAQQGSSGTVIAALCSLVIPGLGQLVQGRILAAVVFFILGGIIWLLTLGVLGVIGNLLACIEAARYKGG